MQSNFLDLKSTPNSLASSLISSNGSSRIKSMILIFCDIVDIILKYNNFKYRIYLSSDHYNPKGLSLSRLIVGMGAYETNETIPYLISPPFVTFVPF